MIDTILFENTVGEVRGALIGGGAVVEVFHRRPDSQAVPGAKYRGRVRKVDRGLNAAFIDIGEQRDGFVRARDVVGVGKTRTARVETLITEGQVLAVTVVAAARADKGARLKAAVEAADDGLVGLVEAAPGLVAEVLDAHLAPETAVAVDGAGLAQEVARWVAEHQPDWSVAIEQAGRPGSLFEERGVEAAIAEALAREVAIPGGGRLVFDRTEAMHVIDIDSAGRSGKGGRGAFDLNLAAMDVIARQVRLRRLAGAIVVDAVRMQDRADGEAVLQRLRTEFGDDQTTVEVLGYSRMGLIEISRQRGGAALADVLTEDASDRRQADVLSAGFGALRMLQRSAAPQAGVHWRLICAPAVAAVLAGKLSGELAKVTAGLGLVVEIEAQDGRARGQEEAVAR